MVVYRTSTLQVRGSNPGLDKFESAFHPFSGSINTQLAWELNTGGFASDCQPGRNIGLYTSMPKAMKTEKGTVGLGSI
ncbi:hypothetical protein TNCV_635061 [Trichonephila clavipes]|nr:hypothetical protein TNCV_635061 [Trichonephila clavipes]